MQNEHQQNFQGNQDSRKGDFDNYSGFQKKEQQRYRPSLKQVILEEIKANAVIFFLGLLGSITHRLRNRF